MTQPELIDTHAHLDDGRFSDDLPAVLDRARAAGVVRVVTIGIDRATSVAARALARTHPMLAPVVGIQPNSVAEANPDDWDAVCEMAAGADVVALGETGLDRYWDRAPFPMQEDFFARHLVLARTLNKPVVIHCREAEADTVRMLRDDFERHGPVSGVMHSYCGDAESAAACVAMGLHISFAGMVTFKSNQSLRDVARAVPLDRLLIETDAPYLAPVPKRGKRNEPAFVVHTAQCLADVFEIPLSELAARTTLNARTLFHV